MNTQIKKLSKIAQKKSRIIVGLMSGTSMDGLDIALCECKNHGLDTQIRVLNFCTVAYDEQFKKEVKEIFSRRDADLQRVCIMNAKIGNFHALLINETLKSWGVGAADVDLIASHGQTIFHAPKSLHQIENQPNATLQIGDGDHIAVNTGIITISDFRQKHIAAGGEGAPLALYGDYLMFSKNGEDRIMLNIGGIANFTFLPGSGNTKTIISTDVGPGNTMMDQFVHKNYSGMFYDKDAKIARKGKTNEHLLSVLSNHAFFESSIPKTTGPELFNLGYLENALSEIQSKISNEDVLHTLCDFSANAIVNSINAITSSSNLHVYLSGGGMHNPLLVEKLKKGLPSEKFGTTNEIGIDPDAKEAVLFAVLANETVAGEPLEFNRKGVPAVCMGKISLPV